MKIWLINHYAVPPKYYPLARQTYFAKYLQRMGHEVIIFAASTVHNSNQNLIKDNQKYNEIFDDGIHYVLIKTHSYDGNGLRRVFNICEFAVKLPNVCSKFTRPDVIVATSMPPVSCAMGIRLAKKYHCKGIAEIADLWPACIVEYGIAKANNPIVIGLRWLEKWIYKKADRIIFTAEGEYDYIVEQRWEKDIPKEKTKYINNGVDIELFNFNREHYKVNDNDLMDKNIFKVVYTGSIRKVNNLGLLLDAAMLIKNSNIKFLIWGDGDELAFLQERVKKDGINNVIFKGKVEKKYIPFITYMADLNLAHNSPSPLFRFGISFNKLFDYLAAGKPILSDFPCKYNPATQHGAGISVDEPTPKHIAEAIEHMASLEEQEYMEFCKNAILAAKEYDFEKLTHKLIDVIGEI